MKKLRANYVMMMVALGIGTSCAGVLAQTASPGEELQTRRPVTRLMAVLWERDAYLVTENGGENWRVVSASDLENQPTHIAKLIRGAMPGAATETASRSSVSPNPATDRIRVRFTLDEPGQVRTGLYDVRGERVLEQSQELSQTGEHAQMIETSSLPNGVYLYRITSNGGTIGNGMVTIAR